MTADDRFSDVPCLHSDIANSTQARALDRSSSRDYLDKMPRRSEAALPNALREARTASQLSLRAVEKLTGISNPYLSQLENGKTINPSPHVLSKLAKAYAVPYRQLMTAAGYPEALEEPPLTRKLAMLTVDLSVDEQEQVASFVSRLRERRRVIK